MKIMKTFIIALVLIFCFSGAAYAEFTNYTANLMGHWKLDGNADDSSSYGNDGSVTGAVEVDDRFSNNSSSYSFSGSSDYISIGDDSALNPSTEITVSTWVNLSSYLSSPHANMLVEKDDFNGNKRDYMLYVAGVGGSRAVFVVFSGSSAGSVGGGSLDLNKWHHIVGTYDGSNLKLYINGVLQNTTSFSGTLNDTDTPLGFGTTDDTRYTRALNGDLDDVRIYDIALSECDVRELYIEELQNKQ